MEYKYDAFISYRHTPLDKDIAKKLHRMLENYKAPLSAELENRKLTRVFRDQEELPTSSDLASNIEEALAQSKYLIVICSPNTPKSLWVNQEIETFIRIHGDTRVLALLIEGEPDEAFPRPLRVRKRAEQDEAGNVQIIQYEIEPLAADIRAKSPRKRYKALKNEILRIIAPILGCSYDTLRQRHKERMIRRSFWVVGVGLAISVGFGSLITIQALELKLQTELAMEANRQLEEQMAITLETQSLYLSDRAREVTKYGDRVLGAYIALSSMPEDMGNPERPYIVESEYALHKALYSYKLDSDIVKDKVISHTEKIEFMELSEKGDYLLSQQVNNELIIWDTQTGQIIWQDLAGKAFSIFERRAQLVDNEHILFLDETLQLYNFVSQKIIWEYDMEDGASLSLSRDKSKVAVQGSGIELVDVATGKVECTIAPFDYWIREVLITPDNQTIIVTGLYGEFAIIPVNNPEEAVYKQFPEKTGVECDISPDSQKIMFTTSIPQKQNALEEEGYCYIYDLQGNEIYSKFISQWGYDIGMFNPGNSNQIALVSDMSISLIELTTDETITTYTSGGGITDILWQGDGEMLVTASDDGTIRFYLTSQSIESTRYRLTDEDGIKDIERAGRKICTIDAGKKDVKIYDAVNDQDYTVIETANRAVDAKSMYMEARISDSGRWVATYNKEEQILDICDNSKQQELWMIDYTKQGILWIGFIGDTPYVLTGEGVLEKLDSENQEIEKLDIGYTPTMINFNASQGILSLFDDESGAYTIVNVAMMQSIQAGEMSGYIDKLIGTQNECYIIQNGELSLIDDNGEVTVIKEDVEDVAFSPKGDKLVYYTEEGFDVLQGDTELLSFSSNYHQIETCYFDSTGSKVFVIYDDDILEVVDIESGEKVSGPYDVVSNINKCRYIESDQATILSNEWGQSIKIDGPSYKPVWEAYGILDINTTGTNVLVKNQCYEIEGSIMMYPYYTTQMAINKGNVFLQDKYIDKRKKEKNHLK